MEEVKYQPESQPPQYQQGYQPMQMQQGQPGYPPAVAIQPGQQTVVVQQPATAVTTTVVTHQPQMLNNWNSQLCDCFNDIKSCLCGIFCGYFYFATLASRMGENCCVGCSGYPAGCVPGGHMAMRSRFRGTHSIQGDICGDCCMMSCCLPCAMCQLSREMDHLGYPKTC